MMVVLMRKPPEGLQGNDAEMARCDALFLVGQEQPQRRSGIIAATEPASRVRTICRCKSYLRRAVMGKVGGGRQHFRKMNGDAAPSGCRSARRRRHAVSGDSGLAQAALISAKQLEAGQITRAEVGHVPAGRLHELRLRA